MDQDGFHMFSLIFQYETVMIFQEITDSWPSLWFPGFPKARKVPCRLIAVLRALPPLSFVTFSTLRRVVPFSPGGAAEWNYYPWKLCRKRG